jgi:hypothetical protein
MATARSDVTVAVDKYIQMAENYLAAKNGAKNGATSPHTDEGGMQVRAVTAPTQNARSFTLHVAPRVARQHTTSPHALRTQSGRRCTAITGVGAAAAGVGAAPSSNLRQTASASKVWWAAASAWLQAKPCRATRKRKGGRVTGLWSLMSREPRTRR